ncbi:Kynurenine formamidase [Psilocybe cubensis]|uniref:Kynurenine formamidase n=2 Tax=Psilocybe cubensis TaxID=181762 RepID=A0ACB8H944_PSICU|nr:Kynurenine formamidase [Psilocybe cubensis]KAH9484229.1 Kynurenine formamidase [Psilocybe cubensis]
MNSIPYDSASNDDPLRQFDFYLPELALSLPHTPSLLCFIHGGAWRSEDKQDHAQLARRLAAATACPVAVPNYRLTPSDNHDPRFRHPIHAQDILTFLKFVRTWRYQGQLSDAFDPDSLVLLGHSCSAHMLASILLDSHQASLVPSPDLLSSVKGVVLSEGIYDLDKLVARFPAYQAWFIEPTFGPPSSGDAPYRRFSALEYPLRLSSPSSSSALAWLLLHSTGDTLIDLDQTRSMYNHLVQIAPTPSLISINTDALKEEHDAIFEGDAYLQLVRQFTSRLIPE